MSGCNHYMMLSWQKGGAAIKGNKAARLQPAPRYVQSVGFGLINISSISYTLSSLGILLHSGVSHE